MTPTTTAWYDNDEFWQTFESAMFDAQRLASTPAEVDSLVQLLRIQPGAHILDLACGPGRHALEFARRGFQVTGVDRTVRYLEHAREQAQAEGLTVEFVQADMREFVRPGAFDVVINMWTAFGYFDDPADDARVVEHMCESLRPGGAFLIEMMGKEVLARVFRPRDWHEANGVLFLEERQLADNWSRNDIRWILIKGSERYEHRMSTRLYSAREIIDLFLKSGMTRAEAFGDIAGAPYDHQATRLVVVGRK